MCCYGKQCCWWNIFVLPQILADAKHIKEKADSTLRSSQAVPHPSTDRALSRLTSEVERDPVHSTWYGRQRQFSLVTYIRDRTFKVYQNKILKCTTSLQPNGWSSGLESHTLQARVLLGHLFACSANANWNTNQHEFCPYKKVHSYKEVAPKHLCWKTAAT